MKISRREMVLFAMLGATMYASKAVMELLPNIHLLGALIVSLTLVYRRKALYPIYVFVFLSGLFGGFTLWWIPYLYIWTLLWGATMLLPKQLPPKLAPWIYMSLCALHGFLFGVLYAPVQALVFGLDWQGTLAWIAAGFSFDVIHGISNFCCGLLILPLTALFRRLT